MKVFYLTRTIDGVKILTSMFVIQNIVGNGVGSNVYYSNGNTVVVSETPDQILALANG